MHSYAMAYNSATCFPSVGEAERITLTVAIGAEKSCLCPLPPHPEVAKEQDELSSKVLLIMM